MTQLRLQFFPWLFDDRAAWEKTITDPRYSYNLPIDSFMAIYQTERTVDENASENYSIPIMSVPSMNLPLPTATTPIKTFAAEVPFATVTPQVTETVLPPKEESKNEEGILSQDEIDALLSGL